MKNLWKVLFVMICASVIFSLQGSVYAQKAGEPGESKEMICPVCKSPIAEDAPKISVQYNGKNYYFCCEKCKAKFEKDPAKYTTCSGHVHKMVYVCPMKECNYKSEMPGKCPTCGMELKEAKMCGDWETQKQVAMMCPVCKTPMAKDAPKKSAEYNGKTYFFCCEKCKTEFEMEPARYSSCSEHMHKIVYICPMKQCDYKSDKPGKCPRCMVELKETIQCWAAMGKHHRHGKKLAEKK